MGTHAHLDLLSLAIWSWAFYHANLMERTAKKPRAFSPSIYFACIPFDYSSSYYLFIFLWKIPLHFLSLQALWFPTINKELCLIHLKQNHNKVQYSKKLLLILFPLIWVSSIATQILHFACHPIIININSNFWVCEQKAILWPFNPYKTSSAVFSHGTIYL